MPELENSLWPDMIGLEIWLNMSMYNPLPSHEYISLDIVPWCAFEGTGPQNAQRPACLAILGAG